MEETTVTTEKTKQKKHLKLLRTKHVNQQYQKSDTAGGKHESSKDRGTVL